MSPPAIISLTDPVVATGSILSHLAVSSGEARDSFPFDLRVVAQDIQDVVFDLRTASTDLVDMLTDLRVVSSTVFQDLSLDLRVTEALVLQDLTLDLRTVVKPPEFKSYVAHRLASVKKDTGVSI